MADCVHCGSSLPLRSGSGRPARFCKGETCRRAWWAANEGARALHARVCAGCGVSFETRRKLQPYHDLVCANKATAEEEARRRGATQLATVWACGGGVQSTAIAALIVRGDLPKPDYAVMVDVQREKSSTWVYVKGTLQPALAAVGVDLVILTAPDVSLYSGRVLLIPAFRQGSGGQIDRFRTFCSNTWKKQTTDRWLRAQGIEQFVAWIGISADEAHRIRGSTNRWAQVRYPLVERCLDKTDCLRLAKEQGWPQPPRTSCWMCPGMSNAEWWEMREDWPEDWARAVAFEEQLRSRDSTVFLHRQLVPLTEVELIGDKKTQQFELFHHCNGSECLECKL